MSRKSSNEKIQHTILSRLKYGKGIVAPKSGDGVKHSSTSSLPIPKITASSKRTAETEKTTSLKTDLKKESLQYTSRQGSKNPSLVAFKNFCHYQKVSILNQILKDLKPKEQKVGN